MRKALAALAMGLASTGALAQAWPSKPVTMIVPFPPGGSTDMIARAVQPKLVEATKGTFIIDNKPGAGGAIGAVAAKNAKPDGYTIFVSSLGPFVIGPHLLKSSGYDPLKDFDYITVAVQAPNILTVNANSPHKTFADFLKFIKANPGQDDVRLRGQRHVRPPHRRALLAGDPHEGRARPLQGRAPAMQDLLGGQVDATFMNINTGLPQIKAGKLRALAITSTKRSPLLPDVPTMEELGFKGVTVYSWQAFAAPKGTPADIKAKFREGVVAALNDPTVKPKLLELGFEIVANTPEQFTAFQLQEYNRWKKVIEVGKITAD
jgi:tripartite-type tricarboxylate transporter receptor subunit TctC